MQYIVLTPCFDGANINKFLLTRQGILVYISATFLDISSTKLLQDSLQKMKLAKFLKKAKPRKVRGVAIVNWREKNLFRLSALGVFLKALNQEGGENAVHCFDSLF